MKKKYFTLCVLSLINACVLVSSCNSIIHFKEDSTNTSSNVYDSTLDLTNNTNPYLQGKDYFYNVSNAYAQSTPSTGNRKILVVPVAFKDQPYIIKYGSDTTIINNLQEVFFSSSNSYWESVSSFYSKSSYGNLNFTGEVLDVYTTKNNLTSYLKYSDSGDATNSICDEVYSTLDEDIISEYDTNGDGVIDCMWFVYLYPYNSSYDLLWAYTYWNSSAKSSAIGNYSWASYEFIFRTALDKNTYYDDAHTFIHETGHQLGLEDYYSYDEYKTNRSPVGGLDMMDCNILDHCAMSKYNLGWVTPSVINSEGTYILKPFESSGDCLILASNFSGTCFDEYFILEYYTPTGLNKLDSTYKYKSTYPLGFTQNGLKITHVDQRLGKINIDTSKSSYTYSWDGKYYNVVTPNTPTMSRPYYYTCVNSNTESRCKSTSRWALVELVQASGSTNLMTHSSKLSISNYAQNSDLFTPSSNVFGKDIYSSYVSNEGWKLPYKVEITSMDDNQIVLNVSKI